MDNSMAAWAAAWLHGLPHGRMASGMQHPAACRSAPAAGMCPCVCGLHPRRQVVNPYGEDDLIDDWDIASKIWTHAFK
jgi:hypothetical protein